jgi:diguanylate cyclase (GGDEF)-like protein
MNTLSALLPLDLLTVKVMTLVTVSIVSLAALFAWRINRQVPGIRLFVLGLLALAVGSLVGLARLFISGNVVLAACNVLMLGGVIAVAQGVRTFRGFPKLSRPVVAGLAGTVALFYFYWLLVHASFGMRVGVVSSAFALLTADASASMFRRVSLRDRLMYWPTGFAFAFASLYLSLRATGAFAGFYGSSLFAPVPVELVSTICANVAYVGCVVGLLLASNTQLRHDAQRLALFDPLTNLPNRRLILDRLLEAEQRTVTSGFRFGIVYLDLDGFKVINDTLGHAAGDDLLRNASAAMASVLRAGDCLGRIGGDEFVVLAEHVETRAQVTALAERLKSVVEATPVAGHPARRMRISCGVAIFPDDGTSAHDVMREADVAMYQAKRRRREAAGPIALAS